MSSLSPTCLLGARGRCLSYLFDGAGAPGEEVEITLPAHLEVYGTLAGAGLKAGHRLCRGIVLSDPARAEVRKEVVADVRGPEARRRGLVEGTAGDRAARSLGGAVTVGKSGGNVLGVSLGALVLGSPIVGTPQAGIYLFQVF